jgi:hypothetical protein
LGNDEASAILKVQNWWHNKSRLGHNNCEFRASPNLATRSLKSAYPLLFGSCFEGHVGGDVQLDALKVSRAKSFCRHDCASSPLALALFGAVGPPSRAKPCNEFAAFHSITL